jgi:putative oxidoreductase
MLEKLRAATRPYAMLPIRFGLGLALLVQGWEHAMGPSRLIRGLERADLPWAEPLAWLVVGVELLGGLLVLLGFQVRWAALALAIWLATDCFVLRWSAGWHADQGGFELSLLHLLAAVGLLLGGAGRASIDSIRGRG